MGKNDGISVAGGVASYTITGLQNGVATEGSARSSRWVRVKGKGKTHRPEAGKTTTTFRNLEAGATYSVWVRAQNDAGKGERVHASITLPEPE